MIDIEGCSTSPARKVSDARCGSRADGPALQIVNNALSSEQRERDFKNGPPTRSIAHCDVPIVSRHDIADER